MFDYSAYISESLDQVIDQLKEDMRTRHFIRLQNRECSVVAGFILSDLLTNLERVPEAPRYCLLFLSAVGLIMVKGRHYCPIFWSPGPSAIRTE